MKKGDILEAPMGPLTVRMELLEDLNYQGTTDARVVEVVSRAFKPHKPKYNGFGHCALCGRPVHRMAYFVRGHGPFDEPTFIVRRAYRHNPIPRERVIPDRERTHCSVCGKPGAWYEFKPGDGRCKECAP